MTSAVAASLPKIAFASGAFMLSASDRLLRFTYAKAARRLVAASSVASGGVSIFSTSAPMSARNIPGSSAGGTRAISSTLIPSSTPMAISAFPW